MDTKPLLYGIIGFLLGGFLVSVVAVTIEREDDHSAMNMAEMMNQEYGDKQGEAFDEVFLSMMIEHHRDALEMASYAEANAGRQEVKDISKTIMRDQTAEIELMKKWQKEWGFEVSDTSRPAGGHGVH
jgi:uncharacterized protein (DUF305 family)